jgi:hypothetical protein
MHFQGGSGEVCNAPHGLGISFFESFYGHTDSQKNRGTIESMAEAVPTALGDNVAFAHDEQIENIFLLRVKPAQNHQIRYPRLRSAISIPSRITSWILRRSRNATSRNASWRAVGSKCQPRPRLNTRSAPRTLLLRFAARSRPGDDKAVRPN